MKHFKQLFFFLFLSLGLVVWIGCDSSSSDDDDDGGEMEMEMEMEMESPATFPDVSGRWNLSGSGTWTAPPDRVGEAHNPVPLAGNPVTFSQTGGMLIRLEATPTTASIASDGTFSMRTFDESTIQFNGSLSGGVISGTYRSTFDEFVREGTFTLTR